MERVPLAGLNEQSKTARCSSLTCGRAFDGAGGVDVADDRVGLLVGVAELEQRGRDGVVDDLDHAAADQLLVLDQREVGLDAGSVAIHHEADGAGGSENCDLRVAVAVFFAVGESFVPAGFAGFEERCRGRSFLLMLLTRRAVHADHVEERLAVDVPAGAGGAGHDVGSRLVSARPFFVGSVAGASGSQSSAIFDDCRVRFAAHDGGDAGGVVASGVGVVGQAGGHEQRAEVGVAETQRTVVVRVAHDDFGGVAGVVHDDFLRGDQ